MEVDNITLPVDILSELVTWLTLKGRARFELVSKRCQDLAYNCPPSICYETARQHDYFNNEWELFQFVAQKPRYQTLATHCAVSVRQFDRVPISIWTFLYGTSSLAKLKLVCKSTADSPVLVSLLKIKLANLRSLQVEMTVGDKKQDQFAPADPNCWANFPNLQKLLIDPGNNRVASVAFLTGIATHLNSTLRFLCLAADDWSPLKKMQKLEDLYLITTESRPELTDVDHLSVAAQLQREANPPGVSIHLSLVNSPNFYHTYTKFKSLLTQLIARPDASGLLERLVGQGLDLGRKWTEYPFSGSRNTLVQHLYGVDKPKGVQGLTRRAIELHLEQGGSYFFDKEQTNSMFVAALTRVWSSRWEWTSFGEWLFGEPWTNALKLHSRDQLLRLPTPRPLIIDFMKHLQTPVFKQRSTFVLSHPEIFGPHSIHEVDHKGKNLMHVCYFPSDIDYAWCQGVDWRVKNNRGYNAVQQLANRCDTPATAQLLLKISDEDFIRHCALDIFGAVACDRPTEDNEEHDPYALPIAVFKRMFALVPEADWEMLVIMTLQTQLRTGGEELLTHCLLQKHDDPRLHRYAVQALVRPYSATYYQIYKGLSTLPTPHLLIHNGTANLAACVKAVQDALGVDNPEYKKWLSVRDDDGDDYLEYCQKHSKYMLPNVYEAFGIQTPD